MHVAFRPLFVLILVLSLIFVQAASAETYNFTLQPTTDQVLANRCFIPQAELFATPGSRILVEGGGIFGSGGNAIPVDLQATTVNGSMSGTVGSQGDGPYGSGSGGAPATAPTTPKALPGAERLMIGQLLDEEGRPLGGVEITVEWTDSEGRHHYVQTTTLTGEAAQLLGDPHLEGYYFLDKDRLGIDDGASVIVRRSILEEQAATPTAQGSEEQQPAAVAKKEMEQGVEYNEVAYEQESAYRRFSRWLGEQARGAGAFMLAHWFLLLLILIGITLLVGGGVDVQQRLETIFQRGHSMEQEALRLRERKAKALMEKEFARAEPGASLRELMSRLLHEDSDHLLIMEGEGLKGILTTGDVLGKGSGTRQLDQVKAWEVMEEPVARIDAEDDFAACTKAALRHRILPVVRNGRVLGVVTRKRLLAELDSFFSLNVTRQMPLVKEAMEEGLRLRRDATAGDAIGLLTKAKGSAILVVKKRRSGERMLEELEGVVGERELLEETYNYASLLEKMDLARIMDENARGIMEGATLFETERVMLDTSSRMLPVLAGSEVKGVVTQRAVLERLAAHFARVVAAIDRGA